MNDDDNSFIRICRSILKIGGAVLIIYLVFTVIIYPLLDASGAAGSAKRQQFLQPVNWDSNTVDPAKTNFSSLVLTGTYETSDGKSGEFEIATCGHDLYFKREWKTHFGGWRWSVEMAMTNYYSHISISWRGMGFGGGGTGGYGNTRNEFMAARRLWGETNFVGVQTNLLVETNRSGSFQKSESFSDLEKFGLFLIPRKIVFKDWNNRQFTYRIEKIQFRNDLTESWFLDKAKAFHYSKEEEQKSLLKQSHTETAN